MIEDAELLREFARDRSEKAFAELVRRHLDLVYGFALRRVGGDAHSADDVTQRVFTDLARKAASLQDRASLAGWLYTSTRFAAADLVRSAQRRRQHEQQAHAMHTLHAAPPLDWEKLRPVLDEAMDQLGEPDREAVLLRYFEGRPLAEVGAKLATSEDAARMRVDRALDKLRALLARRGFTSTSTALATILAHQPVVAAPAALAGTIASSVIATLPAAALVGASAQTLAMTTLQKSFAATVLAVGLGAGVYQATIYARQNSDLAALTRRETDLAAQLRTARTQHAALTARLKSVEAQIDTRLAASNARLSSGDAALEAEMKVWLTNRDRLKQLLDERPHLRIPEMALLRPEAWFQAAAGAKLDSDEGIRRALARLRNSAESMLINKIQPALRAYLKAHDATLPDQISQLLPLIDPPIDPIWLNRYEVLRTGKLSDVPAQNQMEILGLKSFVDLENDTYWRIGLSGFTATPAMSHNLTEARRAFSTANPGRRPASDAELLPYMKWPATAAALEHYQKATSTYPR